MTLSVLDYERGFTRVLGNTGISELVISLNVQSNPIVIVKAAEAYGYRPVQIKNNIENTDNMGLPHCRFHKIGCRSS